MTERIMARVCFAGDCPDLNVDAAAKELEQAGYKIHRLPDEGAARVQEAVEAGYSVLGDDFLEVEICFEPAGDALRPTGKRCEHMNFDPIEDTIWNEIESIIGKYAGLIIESGRVDPDFVPFTGLSDPV